MGEEETRCWNNVRRTFARYYETVAPEGYRALCERGWLRECSEPDSWRYRFELTREGAIERDPKLKALLAESIAA